MCSAMQEIGFKTYVEQQYHSKLLTSFIYPDSQNFDFKQMHDYLYEQDIIIYPGKCTAQPTFRIANIGDLSQDDINYFIACLREYLKDKNIVI